MKYNKMAMLRGRNASRISQTLTKPQGDNTVYGELKLSEQLSQEISRMKLEVDKLREDMEDLEYNNQTLAQELENRKTIEQDQSHELKILKSKLKETSAAFRALLQCNE